MNSKSNINKAIKNKLLYLTQESTNSINNIINPNKTITNFISSTNLVNNDYKSSFIQDSFINEYNSNFKNERLFTISNSKKNSRLKAKDTENKNKKFLTRLIKERKLNLEMYNVNNKKNSIQNEFKKILSEIKDGKKTIFFQKNKEENDIITNKNSNINKIQKYNTTRISYINNPTLKNKYDCFKNKDIKVNKTQIKFFKNSYDKEKIVKKINQKNNINNEISNYKTIDNKDFKKIKLSIKGIKLICSKKKQNNVNNINKIKLSENKKLKLNKRISELTPNENEFKIINKRKTFVEKDRSLKSNHFLKNKIIKEEKNKKLNQTSNKKKDNHPLFLDKIAKDIIINKCINNKKKILIRNFKKNIYSNLYPDKKSSKTNKTTNTLNNRKELKKIEINDNDNDNDNNNDKMQKNEISKGIHLQLLNLEDEKNKKLNKIKIKRINENKVKIIRKNKTNHHKNDKKDKNNENNENKKNNKNKINDEEFENMLNIESEHKNNINIIKTNNFGVNKPKENNMKYTLLKEFEDDEDIKNVNKSQIENIIIGKIEGYKDIIESDKLNKKFQIRSKSSFNIHKQATNNMLKKENKNKNKENLKTFSNKKASFVSFHILDDNSSEIEDLEFDNEYRINDKLINIENEYEFEDMPTYENETKINNNDNLLPFQVSKISFCKYYDKNDGEYKINETIDTDIISLVKINKNLNKSNDKYKNKNKKNTILVNYNNKTFINNNKKNSKNKNCNKLLNSQKSPYDNNYYRNGLYKDKIKICINGNKKKNLSKNNILLNVNNNDCNFIKKKLNRIDYSENNKQRIISQKINNIYNKTKNNNLKIVSNYGSKEKCFIF